MWYSAIVIFLYINQLRGFKCYEAVSSYKWPTVGISVLVRNKEHTLPYFLTCLYNLDYPKDRLYIWIYSDFNEDNSIQIVEKWAKRYASEYNGVYITTNSTSGRLHPDEITPNHWSKGRFRHVIRLREEALVFAKKMWADYLFMLDADVFLIDKSTLKILVRKNFTVVAPMLLSDGLYSNFWLDPYVYCLRMLILASPNPLYVEVCGSQSQLEAVRPDCFNQSVYVGPKDKHLLCGMTDNYYYQRTEDYEPILNRVNRTCYDVPMVNTAVLVDLRLKESELLTYNPHKIKHYNGPEDDIIAFAISATNNDINLKICNDLYGLVLVPLEESDSINKDHDQLLNIKLEAISRSMPLKIDSSLTEYVNYPEQWKHGCSEIYMINLERRTERRELMELSFKELGMDVKLFKAVDGRNLDLNDLLDYSVTLMPNYEDPFHERPMKAGEVGCFLSHYYIWKEIVEKRLATTLVLEDDIHFVPYFRHKFRQLLDEIKNLNWDLVYIGRKVLMKKEEEYVTEHTVRPLYSYWTLGYIISESGARKLIGADPLTKMLPVDEYLPIMFNQHPNETWKSHFDNRNLIALSAAPLLVYPTYYTGEEGYISDTENSDIVTGDTSKTIKNEL